MSKINLLEPSVFNKIAAGEVVERPASVVKELVENSIDAGAKNIEIEIENGGISFIQVTDDGEGIEADDIKKAFLPHATSKVKDAKDLESIYTLGFRGEALASIASVSEVILTTRTENDKVATSVRVSEGIFREQTEVGAPKGTQIAVKNLFFNIPVRYKFLKKPKQEENAISEIVSRLILSNPCIAFNYIVDDTVVFQSSGTGPEDALYSVYGSNILKNIIPISGVSSEIEINGFVGKPTFAKPNTTYQTVIVNGRYVNSKLVSTAIGRVYEDYLMTRSYPFFLIYLNLPIEDIDVNVHPNKLEVRFKNQQQIFGAINHVVDSALLDFKNQTIASETNRIPAENLQSYAQNNSDYASALEKVVFTAPKNNLAVAQSSAVELNEIVLTTKETLDASKTQNYAQNQVLSDNTQNIIEENTKIQPEPVLQKFMFEGMSKNFDFLAVKIVGKLFNTFIIVEVEDKVFIIDQHAAHERLLYDKICQNIQNNFNSVQPLMVPFVFETNSKEHQFVIDSLDNLHSVGFDIDEFGANSFKVSMVPFYFQNMNFSGFFSEILKDMDSILNLKTKDLVVDKFAQIACKHAVKGGDDLSKEEITNLLENIARTEAQLQCPHGRPFVMELKKYDLDKWFKRVV